MNTTIKKSDRDFELIFDLSNRLAMMQNPTRWFNLASAEDEIPCAERQAAIQAVQDQLEIALDTHRVIEALKTVRYIDQVTTAQNNNIYG